MKIFCLTFVLSLFNSYIANDQSEFYIGKLKESKYTTYEQCDPRPQVNCRIKVKNHAIILDYGEQFFKVVKMEEANQALKNSIGKYVLVERTGSSVSVKKLCTKGEYNKHKGKISPEAYATLCGDELR